MSIFITGGTGYIGSKTIDIALQQGYHITVLTRDAAKAKELGFLVPAAFSGAACKE